MQLKPSDLARLTEVNILYMVATTVSQTFFMMYNKSIYILKKDRNYEKGLFNSGKEKAPF